MRLIMKTIIYFTDCQCYTETQAELRLKDKVSALIYPILIEHITKPILAGHIKGFAEQNGMDLIVVGTLGKTGLDRFLLGSVAENVIRHSKIPVLVVKGEKSR